MYRWIVFVHVASVLGLLLVHPVTVAFHLKEERNETRIRELLGFMGDFGAAPESGRRS